MNSSEKISKGISLMFEGLGEALNEFSTNIVEAIEAFKAFNNMQGLASKKPRLPRKLKKKYKKLGIYENWRKENGLC